MMASLAALAAFKNATNPQHYTQDLISKDFLSRKI
jgi:hypothetical protein